MTLFSRGIVCQVMLYIEQTNDVIIYFWDPVAYYYAIKWNRTEREWRPCNSSNNTYDEIYVNLGDNVPA